MKGRRVLVKDLFGDCEFRNTVVGGKLLRFDFVIRSREILCHTEVSCVSSVLTTRSSVLGPRV